MATLRNQLTRGNCSGAFTQESYTGRVLFLPHKHMSQAQRKGKKTLFSSSLVLPAFLLIGVVRTGSSRVERIDRGNLDKCLVNMPSSSELSGLWYIYVQFANCSSDWVMLGAGSAFTRNMHG